MSFFGNFTNPSVVISDPMQLGLLWQLEDPVFVVDRNQEMFRSLANEMTPTTSVSFVPKSSSSL